ERRLELELKHAVASLDGELVVVVTAEGAAHIAPFGGEPLVQLEVESPIVEVDVMSGGEVLLTRDEGGVFRSFDVASGALGLEIAMSEPVTVMGSGPRGALFAIGTKAGEVELWDLTRGARLGELSHGEHLSGLLLSEGDEHLLSWGGERSRDGFGTARVWSVATLEEQSSVHGERAFFDASFDPRGDRFAASNGTRSVDIFDLRDGAHIERLSSAYLHTGLRWSRDGTRLASLSTTKYAPVWYMVQRAGSPNTYSQLGAPLQLVHSEGRTLVRHENGVLGAWELETGAVTPIDTGVIGGVRGMSDAPAGGGLLLWGDGGVGRLDLEALELRWALETGRPVTSADGDERRGGGLNEEGVAFAWREGGGTEELGSAGCVATCPDGEWVATAGEGAEVKLHAMEAGVEGKTLSFESMTKATVTIFELLFHKDGDVLFVNTSERRIRMFDVKTGEEVGVSRGVQMRALKSSADGELLLGTPGDRRYARILDSSTGAMIRDNETHHEADVLTADLNREAGFAVTGSADGVVQLWSVEDGEAHWIHEAARGEITDVVFRGSGEQLGVLAASRDGHLWGVPASPIQFVEEHMPEDLGSWIAHEETRYALPFIYNPPIKFSGLSEDD
ncbi:MAG: WD40 repeat domain-containing protein, partial [Planctomycetes bacterium]|nr:WD40 repeat domain-containing protein [Planctomycetota bacterium]